MKLEFLMEYTADLQRPTRRAGDGPFGTRGLAVVTGGSFEGPRLKGKMWAGGGDWWLRGPDGVQRLDVRVTFETDDGALIYVQYYGVNRSDEGRPVPQPGETSEYGDAYFMTAPRFETGDERYAWLNDLVCVGEGKRTETGVAYRVYAVVNDQGPGLAGDRILALLAHTMADLDQAAQHFDDALVFCRKGQAMEVNPFTINVPNEVLNDLRRLKGRSEGILIQTIPLRHEIQRLLFDCRHTSLWHCEPVEVGGTPFIEVQFPRR